MFVRLLFADHETQKNRDVPALRAVAAELKALHEDGRCTNRSCDSFEGSPWYHRHRNHKPRHATVDGEEICAVDDMDGDFKRTRQADDDHNNKAKDDDDEMLRRDRGRDAEKEDEKTREQQQMTR